MPQQPNRLSSYIIIIACVFCAVPASAQTDTTWFQPPVFSVEGYADVFYSYDLNQPETPYRQTFFYNHNRHNEVSLNHGYLKLAVAQQRYRANVALHTGTYVADNYAAEPENFRGVYEANAGVALQSDGSLWLDAGIMSSHIGFESAQSIQNWTLTRSLAAENSPYYMAGIKLGWFPSVKWELNALVCNGWQHIQKVEGNSIPAFGTQIKYMPNNNTILNYGAYIGTEFPDSVRSMRYFNNFYLQLQPAENIGLIFGFDLGMQQQSKGSSDYDTWMSPVCILKYNIDTHWSTAFRAEYYEDEAGVIVAPQNGNAFKTGGLSINFDYFPLPNIAWRIEGRWLQSKESIFIKNADYVSSNVFFTTSLAVKFGRELK